MKRALIIVSILCITNFSHSQTKGLTGERVVNFLKIDKWSHDDYIFIDAIDSISNKRITILSLRKPKHNCSEGEILLEIEFDRSYKIDLEVNDIFDFYIGQNSPHGLLIGTRAFEKNNLPYYTSRIKQDRICMKRDSLP